MKKFESGICVLKIGSKLAVEPYYLESIAKQIKELVDDTKGAIQFVLVLSGAIATAKKEHTYLAEKDDESVEYKQAMASVGQPMLMARVQEVFKQVDIVCGQDLLSKQNFGDNTEVAHIQGTMRKSLALGILPIINENDTTAVSEIKYGDNDQLAAVVARHIGADVLINLTSSKGIYKIKNETKKEVTFKRIDLGRIEKCDDEFQRRHFKQDITKMGTGGPHTKHAAAKIFTQNTGNPMHVVKGDDDGVLKKVLGHRSVEKKDWTTYVV